MSAKALFTILIAAFAMSHAARAEQPLTPLKALGARRVSTLRPALDASFHFRLDAGVACTGTYISNTGHFLTALHCVAGCLAHNHAIKRELAIDEPTALLKIGPKTARALYTYKMTVDDDRVDEGIDCPGVIGESKHVNMKIVLTGGRGWLTPKETLAGFSKRFPEEYEALLEDGYEHAGDFAILQVEDAKTPNCLPLAEKTPLVGAAVHAVSYPCVSRLDLEALGTTPLYTGGRRTSGFKDSELFRKRGPANLPFSPAVVDRAETFFSSLDIEKCGSGTAVLDESEHVVGVATRVYKIGTDYERGSLESVGSPQVWKDLREKRASDVDEITLCRLPQALTPKAARSTPAKMAPHGLRSALNGY